jgi:sodium transport system permease protein
MRWEKIVTVWRKEMLDTVRDQRSMFLMIVLPLLLYPLLFLLVGSMVGRQAAREKAMQVSIALSHPEDAVLLRNALEKADHVTVLTSTDPRASVQNGDVDLGLIPASGFDDSLRAGASPQVQIFYDGAENGSRTAKDRVQKAIESLRDSVRTARLQRIGADETLLSVVDNKDVNVASKEKMTGFAVGAIVPYLLTILIATGAFHTAIDSTAGEKERNTLETILVSSAGRVEIVSGKYLAIVTASFVATLAGVLGMTITFFLTTHSAAVAGEGIAKLPPSAVPILFLTAVPLALLLAAVLLAIGCFARSTKEAQTFFSYFQFLVIFLALASVFQDVRADITTYLIPVLNVAMVQREMLIGMFNAGHVALTIVSTLALAGAVFAIGYKLFSEERVMFRAR